MTAATVTVEFVVAALAALSTPFTVAATIAGLFAVGACLLWPAAILTLTFPASFGALRVGPAAIDISLTDAVAALGLVAALPHVPWWSRRFRQALLATVAYCAVISTSVIANPSPAAGVEVIHRFVLVMGAVCIGTAVARLGRVHTALRLLVVTAGVFSASGVINTLTHGLKPAYPFGLQKNAFGTLVCMSLLVLCLAPKRLLWPSRAVLGLGLLLLAGLASSQSRGAGLALVATLSIYVIRNGWQGRGRRLVRFAPVFLVVTVALLAMVIVTYQTRDARLTGSEARYSSVETRATGFRSAFHDVILPKPIFGAGPKWFNKPGAPGTIPHDIVVSELSEVGLLGTLALIWFLVTMLRVARRSGSALGEAAWYVLMARVLASAVDIFWVAGASTLPFLVLGLAIGDEELDDA